MIEVFIFNPSTDSKVAGKSDFDSMTIRVDEFTLDAVFAALLKRGWYFGDGGTFVAVRTDFQTKTFGSMLVFNVERPEVPEWTATPV